MPTPTGSSGSGHCSPASRPKSPRGRRSGRGTSSTTQAHRTYRQLLRDEHLDVWLLCWSHDHDTDFHNHDLSAGAVAVVSGSVREERLVLGRPVDAPIARTARAGSSFDFAASDIHRVLHAGAEPAVTIHAYSRPLVRMGSYAVEPNGQLRRHAVSYEEELRELSVTNG